MWANFDQYTPPNKTRLDTIDKIKNNICSANVYIDSFQIKESLKKGADIVLAGRVTDPGLTLGPLLHEFDWKKNDYNKLASGTLAGHIIECVAQCTGGNYSRWYDIDDYINIGYPIAAVEENANTAKCSLIPRNAYRLMLTITVPMTGIRIFCFKVSLFIFLQGKERPKVTYSDRKGKYMKQRGVTLPKV